MLHAPVNDLKKQAKSHNSTFEPIAEYRWQRHTNNWSARSPQFHPLQQRDNLAAMQKAYGNQAVLRKMGRSPGNASMTSFPLSQGGVLQRKCACGNTASSLGTCAKCQKNGEMVPLEQIQTKLMINQPSDHYEQEADLVAEQVMTIPDPTARYVQRGIAAEEGEAIQTKCKESVGSVQSRPACQRATSNGGFEADQNLENRLSNSSGGISLPNDVISFMEPRFRTNFSNVQVHTDSNAIQMNRDLNAQAFTYKQNIYFGSGRSPGKDALTAHELTHVVQQTGGVQTKQRTAPSQEQRKFRPTQTTSISSLAYKQILQRDTLTLPEIDIVAVSPKSLRSEIGTTGYYRKRNDDFLRRAEAGEVPPDYYLNYGDKYVNRFKTDLRPKLSSVGQKWLDCTLIALQTAIEDQRDANPWAFAEMERDSEKFRSFAYGTHSEVYVDCGVCELPIIDKVKILFTPNFKDLFSLEGAVQIGDTIRSCTPDWPLESD